MPKGSPELTKAREDEIMGACRRLYQTMSFKDVTIKEIGAVTSFTRTSIYTYFQTKEEIFLALFEREYRDWTADLNAIADGTPIDRKRLAEELARSLEKRALMLKLLAVNLYDMEENSRPERLVAFKRAYGASADSLRAILEKAFPELPGRERQALLLTILQFLHGVYPYAFATEKQKKAMDEAGVLYEPHTIYELVRAGLSQMLGQ